MKLNSLIYFILCLLFTGTAVPSMAQAIENPGEYITALYSARTDMDAKYMQYMSAASHGRGARKVEKLRQQVLESITQSRYKTTDLPKYKGDNTLRQGSIDYIQLVYRVFNEDYKKIVDMEELAEQSFDEMQAYLLLQEKVSEKLQQASANVQKAVKDFAAKYNVTLQEDKTALGNKLEVAGKLNEYTNDVFLIFLKCNWQDKEMTKAMNNKKLNDVEQARNALLSYANEGLKALDTLKVFNGDPSLANACKEVLKYYKKMAETDMPKLTEFFLKEENFTKMKKSFEAKSAGNRTKEEVDAYNKAVNEYNNGINAFNQVNNKVNKERTQILNTYDAAEKKFNDTHMPYYRK
jgi:exonuclease VII small subunit